MASTRIAELASLIQGNISELDGHFRDNGLPTPSFDENGPVDFGIKSAAAEQARETALAATLELHELLLGPADLVRPIFNGVSLQAIYKFNIAKKVPIGGEISFTELAEKCDLDEFNLRRMLRFAMAYHHCFREPRKGFVAHTAASRRLAEDQLAQSGLGYMFEEVWPGFASTLDALDKFKGGDEPNQTGWNVSQRTDLSAWEYYGKNPDKGRRVGEAISGFTNATEMVPTRFIEEYPWQSVGSGTGTLVDVGGSLGHTSFAIAKAAPGLKFVVQDLPSAIDGAEKSIPTGLENRIEFMEHDFFKEQPVKADVYFFRQIFHNWSDTNVIKILKATIPALRAGARIIVNDNIVPEPGEMSASKEKKIRGMDMTMLTLFNSRERERDDWMMVFEKADKRFKNIKAWVPEGSTMGIVEATWEG